MIAPRAAMIAARGDVWTQTEPNRGLAPPAGVELLAARDWDF